MKKQGVNAEIKKAKERVKEGKQSSVRYAPKALKKDGKKSKGK